MLAIVTPAWLVSPWCFTEAVTAHFRGKDFVAVLPGPLSAGNLASAPPIVQQLQHQALNLDTGKAGRNCCRGWTTRAWTRTSGSPS